MLESSQKSKEPALKRTRKRNEGHGDEQAKGAKIPRLGKKISGLGVFALSWNDNSRHPEPDGLRQNQDAIDKLVERLKTIKDWQDQEVGMMAVPASPSCSSYPGLMARVEQFSETVQHQSRMRNYAELSLCSMCIVMDKLDAKGTKRLLDNHFHDTKPARQKRLLAGAKWANTLVNELRVGSARRTNPRNLYVQRVPRVGLTC